ncbi:hypothetical protein VHEMI03170 [[Torrubiella] hemipterigena]|uniref:Uncharacterized protein n=1 Tax=[Torrubiella] hemipterigena TaxID=1531966 RepID=A0A0A1SRX0_9HYPO|nr:hypothetical protein VHEMI03170 [[Torrubiella] hemipterigena]
MMKRRAYKLQILPAALLIGALYFFTRNVPFSEKYVLPSSSSRIMPQSPDKPPIAPVFVTDNTVEMVVASTTKENVTWLHDHLLDWPKNIYVVDDATAELTVPRNKGREAMAFLTYIIDRYDSLPSTVLFHHAERFQWHNDDPNYDAVALLQNLRLETIQQEGYANLRCAWVLGCPAEIRPAYDESSLQPGDILAAKHIYKQSFEHLFLGDAVPDVVGVTCCSQFAATRTAIQRRSRQNYVRYRDWLLATELHDALSGRVFEYAWHSENSPCPSLRDHTYTVND